jgi:hypothetical protein
LAQGYLTNFVLEWTMPLGVAVGDRLAEACLDARLSLGSGQELLRLVLRWEGGVAESRERGWFEDALADLQAQLPEGVSMRCCFACAFSDYHPVGHGLFGGLACFRDNKDGYLAVHSKNELWPVWPTRTEWVQETFVCPEFQVRVPGTGYRG